MRGWADDSSPRVDMQLNDCSFGAGGSNSVFGSSGSGNFMTKTTAVLATCFFVISLLLGTIAASDNEEVDAFDNLEVPVA